MKVEHRAFAFPLWKLLVLAAVAPVASAGPARTDRPSQDDPGILPGLAIEQLPGCSATIFGVYGTSGRSSNTEAWLGTAFAIANEGDSLFMMTNRHCLGIDDLMSSGAGGSINEYGLLIEFPSGEVVPVSSCAFFRELDLAILVVPSAGLREGEDFVLVPMYPGEDLQIGDEVAASGSPMDETEYYQGTVTFGRISAFRELEGIPVIQLDAPINHGNSGGPLLVERDELYYCVGVNTWGTMDETIEGIGFAINLGLAGEIVDFDNLVTYSADIAGLRSALSGAGPGTTQGRGVQVDGGEGTEGRGHPVGGSGSGHGTQVR